MGFKTVVGGGWGREPKGTRKVGRSQVGPKKLRPSRSQQAAEYQKHGHGISRNRTRMMWSSVNGFQDTRVKTTGLPTK